MLFASSLDQGDGFRDRLTPELNSLQCEATELASELSSWESEFTAKSLEAQRLREEEACESFECATRELASEFTHMSELTSACAHIEEARAEDFERHQSSKSEATATTSQR